MCFWFMAYSSTVIPRRGFHHATEDDDDAASMALARNGGSRDVCVFVLDKSVVEGSWWCLVCWLLLLCLLDVSMGGDDGGGVPLAGAGAGAGAIVDCQLSIVNGQSSIVNCQWSIVSCQSPRRLLDVRCESVMVSESASEVLSNSIPFRLFGSVPESFGKQVCDGRCGTMKFVGFGRNRKGIDLSCLGSVQVCTLHLTTFRASRLCFLFDRMMTTRMTKLAARIVPCKHLFWSPTITRWHLIHFGLHLYVYCEL